MLLCMCRCDQVTNKTQVGKNDEESKQRYNKNISACLWLQAQVLPVYTLVAFIRQHCKGDMERMKVNLKNVVVGSYMW